MEKQLTILIVDDVAINRSILKGIFESDYHVLEADDGTTALDVLHGNVKVDIILLDILMPKMSGIDFLKIVKNDDEYKNIPVIVNTQAGEKENEYKVLELGADDFIVKPYNPKVVKRRINNIVEKYIYQRSSMEKQIQYTKERLETLIDTVPGGIGIFEIGTTIRTAYYNDGLCDMLGYSRAEMENMKNKDALLFIYEPDRQIIQQLMDNGIQYLMNRNIHCKVRLTRKDGKKLWVGLTGRWLPTEEGKPMFHVVFMDLTEEKEAEIQLKNSLLELKFRAERDTLTGIYNRETFYREVEKLLKENKNENYVIGQWNIDRFKVVNELFGSKTGDQILCSIGNQLQAMVQGVGVCGRLESDHFVTCLPLEFLEEELTNIEKLLRGEGNWNHLTYPILLHVGFYRIEDREISVGLMCDRSGMALQMVKGNYLKRWNYYNENLKETILNEQELINDMENALLSKQFLVYYQPIVDVKTRKIISAEALIRWNHPEKGMISPGLFVPLFEKNGFISKLDMYVCEEVCRHQAEQRKLGKITVPVSVNLSRINFYNPNLCGEILCLTQKYQIHTSDIKLEITESAYKDNPQDLVNAVAAFQESGFKVLMDDFGSGYSSLNMLKDVNVDILKIDMKFMDNLENSERASNILYSIIQMAKALKMDTVVEGVETEHQYELLSSMGCGSIQGYYFSKPLPEQGFIDKLAEQQELRVTNGMIEKCQTVLIVDDLEINRASMSEIIKDKYKVIEAEDGVKALEILRKNFDDISLVISDIYMPNLSGLELLEEMQKVTFLKNIPVLMITSYGESENEIKALELGAIDVVTKPYDSEILKKRIENLLRISENENIEIEVRALRESASVRKQIQSMLFNNVAGICRFEIPYQGEKEILRILYANDRFNYLHQIIEEESLGIQTLSDILSNVVDEDRKKIESRFSRAVEKKEIFWQMGYRIQWEDGTVKNILTNCSFEYQDNIVLVDMVEVENVEDNNFQMSYALEILMEQVILGTGINMWTYNIDEDSFDITTKQKNGTLKRHIMRNAHTANLNNCRFMEKDRNRIEDMYRRLKADEQKVSDIFLMEPVNQDKNEKYHWIKITYNRLHNNNENSRVAIGISEDVTEQKECMERKWREQQYREMLTRGAYFFTEVDLTENTFLPEDAKLKLMLYGLDETATYDDFIDHQMKNNVCADEIEYCRNMLNRENLLEWFYEGEREVKFDFRYKQDNSNELEWFTSTVYMVQNNENGHVYASWQLKNIQDERLKMKKMKQLAEHDLLTGILNRITFEKSVDEAYALKIAGNKLSAFIMVDIDNFKAVNDNFGHEFGDSVLKAIAKLLMQTFRKEDLVGRIGGDEFAVFIPRAASMEGILKRAQEVCDKAYMKFDNKGNAIYVSCSCGVVFGPEHGNDFQSLYQKADEALYEAKNSGKNRICVYEGQEEMKKQ